MAASDGNGNGWKNVIIAVLSTAAITSAVGWFSFGKETVRKDELKDQMREFQQAVSALSVNVQSLNTTTAVLAERVQQMEKKP